MAWTGGTEILLKLYYQMEHFLGKAGQGKVFWRACSGTQIAKVRNISIWPTEGLSKIIFRVYEKKSFCATF